MTAIRRLSIPAFVTAALLAAPALAQDKPKAAATEKPKAAAEKKAMSKGDELLKGVKDGTIKVHVDNDKVRVTETVFKPGEGSQIRERGARVTRAFTDATMERVYPDGKTEKVNWKAGDVKWQGKDNFGNRNVGKSEFRVYTVTLK